MGAKINNSTTDDYNNFLKFLSENGNEEIYQLAAIDEMIELKKAIDGLNNVEEDNSELTNEENLKTR